jgi:phage shock protein PspC (stress-responsive transcriptional regulator)
MHKPKRLYRSEEDVIIGGVAAGLGEYFDLDPSLMRVLFLALFFAGGSGFLFYLLLWLILPKKSQLKLGAASKQTLEANAREMETKARQTVDKLQHETDDQMLEKRKQWFGFGLLTVGLLIFLSNLNLIDFDLVWPLTLIILGLTVLLKK